MWAPNLGTLVGAVHGLASRPAELRLLLGVAVGSVSLWLLWRRVVRLRPAVAANKMVAGTASTDAKVSPETLARFEAARQRLRTAGYVVPDTAAFHEVHCNTQPGCERFDWIENGFVQCFVDVDGRSARVMDYAPGQLLQPHKHDIDELFEIRGGAVRVNKWVDGDKDRRETYCLRAGDKIEIPRDLPHALTCDPTAGLQFHELVGTGTEAFAKRATTFLVRDGFVQDHSPPSFAG